VTVALSDSLTGNVTTQIAQGVKMVGVRVWIPPTLRATDTDVDHLSVRAPDGHLFPLRRVATLEPVAGQPQISRENLRQMMAVTARINGRDLGSTVADVKTALAQPGVVPSGVSYQLGGLYQQQQIAFPRVDGRLRLRGGPRVRAAAVPLRELSARPLHPGDRAARGVGGVRRPLAHEDRPQHFGDHGMTMIIGIVTEVAIFYFSEHRDLAHMTSHPSV